MPVEPWRSKLRPASYRGVGFKVDVSAFLTGRRTVTHEYPKRDVPSTEDMGRRARRFSLSAYIIDGDYFTQRDALIQALETEGPGTLVHPYLGEYQVNVEQPVTIAERRERGRMCEIEVTFVEAGDAATSAPQTNTQSQAKTAADNADAATGSALDQNLTTQSTGTIPV